MTRPRVLVPKLLLLAFSSLLFCAMPAFAQEEGTRSFKGELVSGFSGVDVDTDAVQGPYVGFVGSLDGVWKDPRILQYNVSPNLFHGYEWSGPMSGPETNGLSSDATFLGGSAIPFHFYFSHQNIPTPDLGPDINGNITPSFSSTQQAYGVDWSANFKHLPVLGIHYGRDNYTGHSPLDFGGDAGNASEDLTAVTRYQIAGWNLNGSFSRDNSSSDALRFSGNLGTWAQAQSHAQTWAVGASRRLPFDSQFRIDFNHSMSEFDFFDKGSESDYSRATASISSRWTRRFSTNAQATYVSSFADYARQQVLQGTTATDLPPGSPLAPLDTGALSYGFGASFIIFNGLTAHGSYGSSLVLSDVNNNSGLGDNHVVSGGLIYVHRLFGGQFSASYSAMQSILQITPVSTGLATENNSLTNSAAVTYVRTLPWHVEFSGSADATNEQIDFTYSDTLRSYGFTGDLGRRVGRWNLRGRVGWRNQKHDFPYHNEDSYKSFSVTASTRRLQLDVSKNYQDGLAYQFGNTLVFTPGATQYGVLTGLPDLVQSRMTNWSFSGSYRVTRALSVMGLWKQADRVIFAANNDITSNGLGQHGYQFRMDYRFRKVTVAGGYTKDTVEVVDTTLPFYSRTYYVEVRRVFKLF